MQLEARSGAAEAALLNAVEKKGAVGVGSKTMSALPAKEEGGRPARTGARAILS